MVLVIGEKYETLSIHACVFENLILKKFLKSKKFKRPAFLNKFNSSIVIIIIIINLFLLSISTFINEKTELVKYTQWGAHMSKTNEKHFANVLTRQVNTLK